MANEHLQRTIPSDLKLVVILLLNEADMESLPKNSILNFKEDTLQYLRKQYELDKPGRMEESINILEEWLKKQNHFVRKEYSRQYLEKIIILSKGSVERVKTKLDKICTFRTLLPNFFEPMDVKNCPSMDGIQLVFVPEMTNDHYRVVIIRNKGDSFSMGFLDFYKYALMICEYSQTYDYCNGLIAIIDYSEANILEILKAINLVELRQAMSIIIEGYGMRLKGIHFITKSRAIDTLVSLFKQAISPKVAQRIQVHNNVDTIEKYIPKEIMPMDYGGKAPSIKELSEKLNDVFSSKEFTEHYKEMQEACTNETFRSVDKFNEQIMGMPGSFRKLAVD